MKRVTFFMIALISLFPQFVWSDDPCSFSDKAIKEFMVDVNKVKLSGKDLKFQKLYFKVKETQDWNKVIEFYINDKMIFKKKPPEDEYASFIEVETNDVPNVFNKNSVMITYSHGVGGSIWCRYAIYYSPNHQKFEVSKFTSF